MSGVCIMFGVPSQDQSGFNVHKVTAWPSGMYTLDEGSHENLSII